MKVTTKLIAGGWMVFVDGVEYLERPRTKQIAEIIAANARVDIKNGALKF